LVGALQRLVLRLDRFQLIAYADAQLPDLMKLRVENEHAVQGHQESRQAEEINLAYHGAF
jgi:hypothetical protein